MYTALEQCPSGFVSEFHRVNSKATSPWLDMGNRDLVFWWRGPTDFVLDLALRWRYPPYARSTNSLGQLSVAR